MGKIFVRRGGFRNVEHMYSYHDARAKDETDEDEDEEELEGELQEAKEPSEARGTAAEKSYGSLFPRTCRRSKMMKHVRGLLASNAVNAGINQKLTLRLHWQHWALRIARGTPKTPGAPSWRGRQLACRGKDGGGGQAAALAEDGHGQFY